MPDVTIPDTPQTRTEQYLAAANGQEVELPAPMTREEEYLHEIATKMQGGGGGVTVEPLSVTENGEYAEPGKAFSPVTVAVGRQPEVPAGYTQLQFLQSTGTQWIKTNVVPSIDMRFQVTGQRLVDIGYAPLCGCRNPYVVTPSNNGATGPNYYITFGNSGEKSVQYVFPSGSAFPPVFTVDKTQATFDTYGMAQNAVAIGATELGQVDSRTRIALFGRYNGATDTAEVTAGIIFRAKFWENDVLIGDYVPAKRDADDVLGMYDIVSDVFYTNAGTGVFIGGEYE